MTAGGDEIARREYRHGKVAYGFQWNKTHHEILGKNEGDLASLWAHLTLISSGRVPSEPFTDPFYARSSGLKLTKMKAARRVALRKRLIRAGSVVQSIENDLVQRIREYHRARNELSYSADHGILKEFLHRDPDTIAIEVPVWSDRYRLSGHVDLIRYVDGRIQVCDYKPGPLDSTPNRFLESLPQVSAYGEMMAHHLAGTLRSALNAPLLPNIQCCVFDSHSCWEFGAEMFVTLLESGHLTGL
ncbi:MAG: PD-(D/E)XK nuclease family protein [Candidatus Thorarchaeota archaeon]